MSKPTIDEIEEYFNGISIPAIIQISKAEFIRDVPATVKSHIEILRANPKNPTFLPYYNRLLVLYEKIKQ